MADTEDEEPTPNSSEEDELERGMSVGSDSFPEALTHFPDPSTYEVGTRPYLQVIRRARAAVDIPIIASLNGTTGAGWIDFAKQIEQAGSRTEHLFHSSRCRARWNRC
jgi:dihydroorotate dehydrogenase (fumarate)